MQERIFAVAAVLGAALGGVILYLLFWLTKQHASAKRIILIRHGESLGNVDVTAYVSQNARSLSEPPQVLCHFNTCRRAWLTIESH